MWFSMFARWNSRRSYNILCLIVLFWFSFCVESGINYVIFVKYFKIIHTRFGCNNFES